MKKVIALTIAAILLSACGHDPKPTVITKLQYVAVKPSAEFLDENKCPWPSKSEYIRSNTELEYSDWTHAAYQAWTCEHKTRMKIKEQSEQQAADIEKRNQDANAKSSEGESKSP